MKLRVLKKFVDKETGDTRLPKKQFTTNSERGQDLINKGYCAEVKSRKKKEEDA
tara:strand:+ start:311 stop:472 length:162 start_codon:yes stop_codon:yes gene_type:complete